ncbi:hypothetical protein JAAARDRAFT_37707 [Jaapia argillacea MUCL 33604]|uniref:DUF6533 domain-containing protein n=1 Tax=Jaapia argillacea MUCL 33604 TaxID=933084 RepID=A0A067PMZ5_9AGAM|nr:hypothetical protein JAAARDRAFT_37707 [Jaapia argillacea MUCL 33604]
MSGLLNWAVQQADAATAVSRSSVAATAFLVYDILLTLDDEVKLIWPKRWSFTKFLYFFVRYTGVAVELSLLAVSPDHQFTQQECERRQIRKAVAAMSLIMAVDFILILRVRALYALSKTVVPVLFFLYLLEIGGMTTSFIMSIPKTRYIGPCLPIYIPKTILIYILASVTFQGVLLAFTATQFVLGLREGWGRTRIIFLLMRDGTWAFFMIFVIMLLQTSLYTREKEYTGLFYAWSLTTFSFAGYRILLNLQKLSPVARPSTSFALSNITSTNLEFSPSTGISGQYRSGEDEESTNDFEFEIEHTDDIEVVRRDEVEMARREGMG